MTTAQTHPPHPTRAELEAAKKKNGGSGWTRAQLTAWGVPNPLPKGWKQKLYEMADRYGRGLGE